MESDRNSVSVGSLWNETVSGRDDNEERTVSKPYELVYERGGKVGGFGLLGQLRLQRIYEIHGRSETRAVVGGSVELPSAQLAPRVQSLERIDTMLFLGNEHYGWVRGQLGAVYEPNKHIRVGGAVVGTVEFGKSAFSFDKPVERNGFNFRVDFNLGPTKISYLQKYDTRLEWYDREIYLSQIAGCFEPFLVQRQFPRSLTLGLRLRTGNFDDLIRRTSANKPASETTVISPSP